MMRRAGVLLLLLLLLLGAAAGEGIFTVVDDEDAIVDADLIPIEIPAMVQYGLRPMPWSERRADTHRPDPACYLPDRAGYHDPSIDVRIEKLQRGDTLVYVMYVTLQDASQFRTVTAGGRPYTQTKLVATMTTQVHAVCGMNGDYFGYHDEGIVYRNGKQLRFNPVRHRDTLIVDEAGDFHVIKATTREKWQAYTGSVVHTFSFGPALVINGEMNQDALRTTMNLGKNKRIQRIALCQLGPLQYMIVTCDGPQNRPESGMTIADMVALCHELGAVTAYNMDGASSSTIILNNKKINARGSKQRDVSDCIWFATLMPSR